MKQRIRTAESKVNKMSQASPAPLVMNNQRKEEIIPLPLSSSLKLIPRASL